RVRSRASAEKARRNRPKGPLLCGSRPRDRGDADAADHRNQNHFRDVLVPPGVLCHQYRHVRADRWCGFRLSAQGEVPTGADVLRPGRGTLAFALTTDLAVVVHLTLVTGASPSLTALVAWAEFALCMALPFFFSGIVVSLALTRSPYSIGKVYGADLIGAATGWQPAMTKKRRVYKPRIVGAGAEQRIALSSSNRGPSPSQSRHGSDIVSGPLA